MFSTALGDEFKTLNGIGNLRLVGRLPAVVYSGESIFNYEYLREYEAKIEKTLRGV